MSDQTTTPSTTPETAAPVADPTAEFKARIADLETKLAERDTLVSTLTGERDTFAEKAKLIESLTGERDQARGEVKRLVDENRTTALFDALRNALPHAPRNDIVRTVKALAADGKVPLSPESPDKAAATVLELLKSESSSLLRTPVGASGATNPTITTSPQVDPLLAVFGPRRK